MMKNNSVLYLLLFILTPIFSSCDKKPEPIVFGEDACEYCRMAIVDKQHAAQLVTEKGKNYKYDAIECMMNDLMTWDKTPIELYLVADYANPGKMTDANTASYLITKEIPSPMGEFLSAFANEARRDEFFNSSGGRKLNWDDLNTYFDAK